MFLDIFLHCEKHVFKTRPVGNGFTWSTHLIHSKNLYLPKKKTIFQTKKFAVIWKNWSPGLITWPTQKINFYHKNFIYTYPKKRFSNEKDFHTCFKELFFYPKKKFLIFIRKNNQFLIITRKFFVQTKNFLYFHFRCVLNTDLLFFMSAKLQLRVKRELFILWTWSQHLFDPT